MPLKFICCNLYQIVVFDDGDEGSRIPKWSEDMPETSGTFLTRILKYMETPQYLRHALVPKHSNLQYAVNKFLSSTKCVRMNL